MTTNEKEQIREREKKRRKREPKVCQKCKRELSERWGIQFCYDCDLL